MIRLAAISTLLSLVIFTTSTAFSDEFDELRNRFESLEARVAALEQPSAEYDLIADENLSLAKAVKQSEAGDKIGVKGSHTPFEPSHVKPGITIEGIKDAVIVGRPSDWGAIRLQGPNCRDVTIRNLSADARNCRPETGVTGIKVTIDSERRPATGVVLENVNILGVVESFNEDGRKSSVGLLCDHGADVTWHGGKITNVNAYGVYGWSKTVLKDLEIKSGRWGLHFSHNGGDLTGSQAVNCDVWESDGIICWRNKGLIKGCKAKLVVVGGTSRGWTVTKNTVKRIKALDETLTILSTTPGVEDDNEYQNDGGGND